MSDTLLQDAQNAHQGGQLADATRLYHEFLSTNPTHVPSLYALGVIYFQESQFTQAEYLLTQALKTDPLFADGLCMRGVTLVKLGRPDEALACFEDALRVKPDNMPQWAGPYLPQDIPMDPWAHPYLYKFPGDHGDEPDIISLGADGNPGGDGNNADIVSWSSQ